MSSSNSLHITFLVFTRERLPSTSILDSVRDVDWLRQVIREVKLKLLTRRAIVKLTHCTPPRYAYVVVYQYLQRTHVDWVGQHSVPGCRDTGPPCLWFLFY